MKQNQAASRAARDGASFDDEPDGEGAPEANDPDADGHLLVEHEGLTYRVPAALKGALMRHQDYQQGLQALQDGHQQLQAMAQAHGENLGDYARLIALADQIAQMHQLNWPALQQQNPAQAQQLLQQLFQLRQNHDAAASQLAHKEQVQAFEHQQRHAAAVRRGHAVLADHIDGWSPHYAQQLAHFALSQGLEPHELAGLDDPRLVILLHHAYQGHQAQAQHAAGQRLARTQAVRPAVEVGGGGASPSDPNRMSTDDWMRHRRSQLRKKVR